MAAWVRSSAASSPVMRAATLPPEARLCSSKATSFGSRSGGRSPASRALRASAASTPSQRFTTARTSSCSGPGRASYSTDAVVTKHPPGNTPSRRWAIHASTIASSRGSPGVACPAGRQTAVVKRSTAAASTARCIASLSPKRPIRPLLLMSSSPARRPIVSPSSPSTEARATPASTAALRLAATSAAERRGMPGTIQDERSYCISRGMRLTWLGWAGAELEADGVTVVVDPLDDAAAVFAPLGERAAGMTPPAVVPARSGSAVAGMVTHLHRDHADAAALAAALAPGAAVLEPPAAGGEGLDNLGLVQADRELAAAAFERRPMAAWEALTVGPFTVTALPAVDGTGDPQVAWLVEADGVRVLHLGDTMFHGYWWRMAHSHGPFDVVLVPVN